MGAPETNGQQGAPAAGKDTSEYKVAKSAKFWGIVGMALGILILILNQVPGVFPAGETPSWIGGALAIVCKINNTLVDAGFIMGRVRVKEAHSREKAPKDTRHLA